MTKPTQGSPKESQWSVPPAPAAAWCEALFHRWSLGGRSVGTAKTSTRSIKAVWPHSSKKKTKPEKKVYISTYILIVLLNFFIVIYYCAYVSSFHTPPFFSISRLLSSRAFWSRDSSPWRLSSSFQQMKDTCKPLWVTYCHYIYHSVTVHRKNRWLAFFLCNICTQLAETRKFPGQREDRKQSIPVISNRAVLLCYYIGV